MMPRSNLSLFCGVLVSLGAASNLMAHDSADHQNAPPDTAAVTQRVRTGSGENMYESVPGWCSLPQGQQSLGATHGGIVHDKAGNIYFSMDGGPHGLMVYSPEGKLLRGMADEFGGIHGLVLREEGGEEFLYAAHLRGKQALKLKLDGTLVWKIPIPTESGKYEKPEQYNPTAIAVGPDGAVYVADGYGQNWIHQFDKNQKYVRSFGGAGKEPGKFTTCHGLALDTRGEKPLLLVCDRENRRLQHFDLDGNFVAVIAENLRRPCTVSFHDKYVAVAELEARVTILDANNAPIAFLGDNPNRKQWANFNVAPSEWRNAIFTAPHGVCFDNDANLYVMDWNASGRVTRFNKLVEQAAAR